MNDFDRDNLEFFLTACEAEFDEWAEQASPMEIEYAMKLFREHRTELMQQELDALNEEEDVTQAADLLKKFTLNKS